MDENLAQHRRERFWATLCLLVMKEENFRGAGIFCLLFVDTKSKSPIKGENGCGYKQNNHLNKNSVIPREHSDEESGFRFRTLLCSILNDMTGCPISLA